MEVMRRRRRRRGFSLVELTLTVSVMVVLVVAANGIIAVCARGVDATRDIQRSCEVDRLIDRMRFDLTEATALSSVTSREVRFTVPDRDGDLAPESLGYAWSGVANSSLTRQDDASFESVLASVTDLTIIPITVMDRGPATTVTTSELLLSAASTAGSSSTLSLGGVGGAGLTVKPVAPPGSDSWSVTRYRYLAKRGMISLGSMYVGMHDVDGSTIGNAMEAKSVSGSLLSLSSSWQDIAFTNATMPKSKGSVAVVLAQASASSVSLDTTTSSHPSTSWSTYSNSKWSGVAGVEPVHELYGTFTLVSPGADRIAVTGLLVTLTAANAEESVTVLIPLPNRPTSP